MHTPQGMVKTGVMGSGIHQIRKPHLRNMPEPLEIRMLDQVKNQRVRYSNKSVNWIVKDCKLAECGQDTGF